MSNSPLSSAVIAVIVVIVSGYVVSYSVDTDTVTDIIFAGMLNAAYATHVFLSLTPTDNIDDIYGSPNLKSATDIVIFESGTDTYAAVVAVGVDGIQILNVTDPYDIAAAGSIVDDATLVLNNPSGIAIFESSGHRYAAVAANRDHGVQILDITDPYLITAAGSITNSTSPILVDLLGITTFESGGHTYAAVITADFGVQILDVTDPSNIAVAGNKTTPLLSAGQGITTFESGTDTYVAVAGNIKASVQILNVTDPSDIAVAGNITAPALTGGQAITTFESNNRTYAAVTSVSSVSNLSILDVTDPYKVTAAGSIEDDANLKFENPFGVAIFKSGSKIYAAVTGNYDHGVQILDVTDPSRITAAGSIDDLDDSELELKGAFGIATFESGGRTYAAVAANEDFGVQILDVTDPPTITATDNIRDTDLALGGANGITTFESGNRTYVAVAAFSDDGVQMLDVTDPSDITAAGTITDDGTLTALRNANGITTFESGTNTYAAVTSYRDGGVQMLDVTDPYNITAAGNITDNGTMTALRGGDGIAIFESGGRTYAAVASFLDNGVQILDVTDPLRITAASHITDGGSLELESASDIAIFESGDYRYAAVAANEDDGVQILNITNPSMITATASIDDDDDLDLKLDGARGIATFESGGHTYAAVTTDTEDSVQILNITDPSVITAVTSITNSTSVELGGAWRITTFESGGHTYAAVTAYHDDGVQILDVTDPTNIMPAGNITDGGSLALYRPAGIATFESGGHTYAAVAANLGNGVQIIRIDTIEHGTTPPDIILNGPATVYVNIGDPYDEQGAVCDDDVDDDKDATVGGDPVDTNTQGSYIVTYDCTDVAGNVAETATRKVIVRVPGPATPADVTSATPNGTYGPGEIVDVRITFTEKVSLETFGIRDNDNGANSSPFNVLQSASSVTTIMIDSRHYALVSSFSDDGLQIIDITTPSSPTAVASVTDNSTANPTDYTELDGASSITTTTIDSRHYALVASRIDNGVQIIDITDPSSPSAVANVTDSTEANPTDYTVLKGAISVTTTTIQVNGADRHYALVASFFDDGVQIIDITDPSSPSAVAGITDCDTNCTATDYAVLKGAISVTTTAIQVNGADRHYALVSSSTDDGVQIINITDPSSPSAIASVADSTGANPTDYTVLENAVSVTTATIGTSHYALVASQDNNGVQIINITDPSSPSAVAGITDCDTNCTATDYTELKHAISVTTTAIQVNGADRHYALVASFLDNGVQIIDITDPSRPSAVASVEDSTGENPTDYTELKGVSSVTTTQIGSRHYALVSILGRQRRPDDRRYRTCPPAQFPPPVRRAGPCRGQARSLRGNTRRRQIPSI